MARYDLMHGNVKVMAVEIDGTGHLDRVVGVDCVEHGPVGTRNFMGRVDTGLMTEWWARRSIPLQRANLKDLMSSSPDVSPQVMAQLSLGLNLSDQYWVRPAGSELEHDAVSFFRHPFPESVSDAVLFGRGRLGPGCESPSFSTGGDMPKAWYREDGAPILYKASGTAFGQEPYNEVIASRLCDTMGVEHIPYRLAVKGGVACCKCPCGVGDDEDLVPAIDVWHEVRRPGENDRRSLDGFVRFMRDQGFDACRYLDPMIVMDYLMRNTDRHWGNFGLIRDAGTLEWKRPMPLFDHGNSLYHDKVDIDPTDDGRSRLTDFSLYEDLKLVSEFTPGMERGARLFPDIVEEVLDMGRLPRGRKLSLVSAAEHRSERLLSYFDRSLEQGDLDRGDEHEV